MEAASVWDLKDDEVLGGLFQALCNLGWEGTTGEIREYAAELLGIEEDVWEWHDERRTQREIDYRLSWARSYLKRCGILENPRRGYWRIARDAKGWEGIEPDELRLRCRERERKREGSRSDKTK